MALSTRNNYNLPNKEIEIFFGYLSLYASSYKEKDLPTTSLINNVVSGYLALLHDRFFKISFNEMRILFKHPKIMLIDYLKLLINTGFFNNSVVTPQVLQIILNDIDNNTAVTTTEIMTNRNRKKFYDSLQAIQTSFPKISMNRNLSLDASNLADTDDLLNLINCGSIALANLTLNTMISNCLQNLSTANSDAERNAQIKNLIPLYHGKYSNDYTVGDYDNSIKNCELVLALFDEITVSVEYETLLISTKNDLISILNDQAVHALKFLNFTKAYYLFQACSDKATELGIDSTNIFAARMRLNFIKCCVNNATFETNWEIASQIYLKCTEEFSKINPSILDGLDLKYLQVVRNKAGNLLAEPFLGLHAQNKYLVGIQSILKLFHMYFILPSNTTKEDSMYITSAQIYLQKFFDLMLSQEKSIKNLTHVKQTLQTILQCNGISEMKYSEYMALLELKLSKYFLAGKSILSALTSVLAAKKHLTTKETLNNKKTDGDLRSQVETQSAVIYKILFNQSHITILKKVEYLNKAISHLQSIPNNFKSQENSHDLESLFISRAAFLHNFQYSLNAMIVSLREILSHYGHTTLHFFSQDMQAIQMLYRSLGSITTSASNPGIFEDSTLHNINENLNVWRNCSDATILTHLGSIQMTAQAILMLRHPDTEPQHSGIQIMQYRA